MNKEPLKLLLDLYHAGVAAADPANCMEPYWPKPGTGNVGVIACGKAARQMAILASRRYGPATEGVVIYPDNDTEEDNTPTAMQWYPAPHPVPDERSMTAAEAALAFASSLSDEDLLLVLLSGGGSSLMCLPADGVSLSDKQDLGRQLLASGATISEINGVRKHISKVKGGRLANASSARVFTLAISDIPGDDASMVASGPTCESETTLEQAREIIKRYGILPSQSIHAALNDPSNECPRFPVWPPREIQIVSGGNTALTAAAALCEWQGIEPIVLGDGLEGEARELGKRHAKLALERASNSHPCCILSGGETTVTVAANPGMGGRNTEYALALALGLDGHDGIWSLSADTDGIDGVGGHTGATTDPGTLYRAAKLGIDPRKALENNDSADFFERVGGLLVEGPTGTNVNDFRAILINP
ncbi:MAG: DUF4147 domain-containing protein [Xanthomonadales bacterium]|jgi:hydroxypyruvate reductase|nr:DUF4147 domain-containing protein [Xanthomonadales bacterium]